MQGYPIDEKNEDYVPFQRFNNHTRRNMEGCFVAYKDKQDAKYSSYSTTNYYNDDNRKNYLNSLNFLV